MTPMGSTALQQVVATWFDERGGQRVVHIVVLDILSLRSSIYTLPVNYIAFYPPRTGGGRSWPDF